MTFVLAVAWNGYYTARQLLEDLAHLTDPEDRKIAHDVGGAEGVYDILDIKHKTPDHAVIGFPRPGEFSTLHWSLLYPRRVVLVESLEEFEREQPTHLLVEGDFPPYAFPGDPRPSRGKPPPGKIWIIMVQSPQGVAHSTLPHGWFRVATALVEGVTPLTLGAMLLQFSRRRWSLGWPAWMAVAFLLGAGVHTLLLFCLSLGGIPLTSWSVLTVDGVVIMGSLTAVYSSRLAFRSMLPSRQLEHYETRSWIVVAFLGLLLLIHLLINLSYPISYIDAVGSYDYRAKAIVQQGTVALWQFFKGVGWVNFHYPFFQTMLHAHHYLLGGSHAAAYGTFMLGAFLVMFSAVVRALGSSPFQSLVFTAVLGGYFNVVALSGHVITLNFPQMVYSGLGLFFLLDYLQRQETPDLILSGLLLGLAGWVRTDSFMILAVACLVVLLAGRLPFPSRLRGLSILVGCYAFLTLPYEYFIRAVVHYDVAAYYKPSMVSLLDLQKLWHVLAFFAEHSLHFEIGNIFLPWLLVILADWPWRVESRPLLLTTGLMIAGWVGLFTLIGSADWDEIMRMSAVRWYVNLTPLYLASIAQTGLMRRAFEVLEGRLPLRVRLEW